MDLVGIAPAFAAGTAKTTAPLDADAMARFSQKGTSEVMHALRHRASRSHSWLDAWTGRM